MRKQVKTALSFVISFLACNIYVAAQNLFVNQGLEELNNCTELKANCAPEAWFYIRPATNPLVSGRVVPDPAMGTNLLLVPIENVFAKPVKRPLVYTMLSCPLIKDVEYKLSFLINTAGRNFYYLDVLFSENEPGAIDFPLDSLKPSIRILPGNIMKGRSGWKEVEVIFKAKGGEHFFMLGNFDPVKMKYSPEDRMNSNGQVYYFLDDLLLFPLTTQAACAEQENNIRRIYNQNKRHTEGATITSVQIPKGPVFINDTITLPAAFFETNSAKLKPQFTKKMDSILVSFPSKPISKIEIIGHTDNRGKPDANELLSKARAESVKEFLVNKLPQYSELIYTFGKGQSSPVETNDTDQGRQKNRRVEIILTLRLRLD
jgi:outer membrane protein OmpA-like peptidoglycan-associated protein